MRKLLACLISTSIFLGVTGCGGSGLNDLLGNSLAGSYTGSGTVSNSNDVITANITIGSDGTLSGTLTDTTAHDTATVGGNVNTLGVLSGGTISLVNSSNVSLGSGSLTGDFEEVNSGQSQFQQISASLVATVGGNATTFTFSDLQSTNPLVVHRSR